MENFSTLAKLNIAVIQRYKGRNDKTRLQTAINRVDVFYAAQKFTDEEYNYIQNIIKGTPEAV